MGKNHHVCVQVAMTSSYKGAKLLHILATPYGERVLTMIYMYAKKCNSKKRKKVCLFLFCQNICTWMSLDHRK